MLRALTVMVVIIMLFPITGGKAGTAPNLLDYNGGAVLQSPEIHNVYMDFSWDADNPPAISMENIDAFTGSLVQTNYFGSAAQYGVGTASFTGSHQAFLTCPPPIVGGLTDFFSIIGWMQCITAPSPIPFTGTISGVPAPDNNTVYAVYLPTGTQINDLAVSSCADFNAYHFFGSTPVWQLAFTPLPTPVLAPQTFAYTILPVDCATAAQVLGTVPTQFDGVTYLMTHEILEAATDPVILKGWVNNSDSVFNGDILKKGEAADICEVAGVSPARLPGGIMVAPYWSNSDGACVPIVDTIPPVTTAALSPPPNAAGWNSTSVTVTLTSTDNEPGGTGVAQIQFTLSGAQTGGNTVSAATTSFVISNQGVTTVTFFGTDNAGNVESPETVTVMIDETPPTVTAPPNVTVGTGPGATVCGAVVPPATLGTPTATDLSGIVSITSVTGVPPGNLFPVGTTSVVYTATNVVNLTASATQLVTVNDTTPPVLATPANITVNATSPAGAVVNYTLPAATDNCPGVTEAATPVSGSTFAIGTTTVTVTATDAAHNTTAKTFTVTVVGAAGQTSSLGGLVTSFGLPQGTTTSLLTKLNAVLAAINVGDTATACSDLTAFINEVNAQSGKMIPAAEAAQLIAAATQIKAVLGCA